MELLNARDRFRQAPPLDLPQLKHGEVEGYLGVLITLYHIRKLLSSHGVRPAYDMIEDKLRQGYVLVPLQIKHRLNFKGIYCDYGFLNLCESINSH